MKVIFLSLVISIVSACATSGSNFRDAGFGLLEPGETTIEQASEYFGAKPEQVILLPDGSKQAQWLFVKSNGLTSATDIRSAVLAFDSEGNFVRLQTLTNVELDEN